MKEKILDFIHNLIVYDYFLFGGIFVLFLLFLVLAIVFKNKMGLAVFMVFLAFGILTAGPVVGYVQLHKYLFKNKVSLHEIKVLEFTEALLIKGTITNTSTRGFKECTIYAGVHKVTHNPYIDRLYPHIPFKKGALLLHEPIDSGESAPFKLFIEPFRYEKDFNITIKANCS